MELSTNYIFYFENTPLNQTIEKYSDILADIVTTNTAENIAGKNPVPDEKSLPVNFDNLQQHNYDSNLLEQAETVFKQVITEQEDNLSSLELAGMLDGLGNIMSTIAQSKNDEDLLRATLVIFDNALDRVDESSHPLECAKIKYHLANVLYAQGLMEKNTDLLQEAIDTYMSCLVVWSRTDYPAEWVATMHNIAITFYAHGRLLKGSRTFEKSIASFRNSLAMISEEDEPLNWAVNHNNRACVLLNQGEREDNPKLIKQAIESYEKVLDVWNAQKLSLHLGVLAMVNLATTRKVLAELNKDKVQAQQAADDFEKILAVFDYACDAQCIKHCEAELSKTNTLIESLA